MSVMALSRLPGVTELQLRQSIDARRKNDDRTQESQE